MIVKVNAAPPAVVLGGLNPVIAGPGRIVKGLAGWNVTPPEVTVTCAVPELAIRLAATEAVN